MDSDKRPRERLDRGSPTSLDPSEEDPVAAAAAIARAKRNVREWKSYLPDDCVEAMIRLGWHFST